MPVCTDLLSSTGLQQVDTLVALAEECDVVVTMLSPTQRLGYVLSLGFCPDCAAVLRSGQDSGDSESLFGFSLSERSLTVHREIYSLATTPDYSALGLDENGPSVEPLPLQNLRRGMTLIDVSRGSLTGILDEEHLASASGALQEVSKARRATCAL